MTCGELVDLLLDFVGEELDPGVRAAIEGHLCGCPPCVLSVELYRATIVVARAVPAADPPLPPAVEARLRAAVEAARGRP